MIGVVVRRTVSSLPVIGQAPPWAGSLLFAGGRATKGGDRRAASQVTGRFMCRQVHEPDGSWLPVWCRDSPEVNKYSNRARFLGFPQVNQTDQLGLRTDPESPE